METKTFNPEKSTLMQQRSAYSVQWYFKRKPTRELFSMEEIKSGENIKKFHSEREDLRPHKEKNYNIINHQFSFNHYKALILKYWREDRIIRAILYENLTGQKLFQLNDKGITEINNEPVFGITKSGHHFLETIITKQGNIEIPEQRIRQYYHLRKQYGLI